MCVYMYREGEISFEIGRRYTDIPVPSEEDTIDKVMIPESPGQNLAWTV